MLGLFQLLPIISCIFDHHTQNCTKFLSTYTSIDMYSKIWDTKYDKLHLINLFIHSCQRRLFFRCLLFCVVSFSSAALCCCVYSKLSGCVCVCFSLHNFSSWNNCSTMCVWGFGVNDDIRFKFWWERIFFHFDIIYSIRTRITLITDRQVYAFLFIAQTQHSTLALHINKVATADM